MFRSLTILFFCMLIGYAPANAGNDAAGPETTVLQFFKAFKIGDIETMSSLITGPFYARRKALLERNIGYHDFLKNQLEGVEFEIISSEINNDDTSAIVTLRRAYPDGSTFNTTLTVLKDDTGTWKIVDERPLSGKY